MKQTDIDRQAVHTIKFIVKNSLTQEDALAIAAAILNDHGLALLKANPVFVDLDEK